jgi:hypothetical protein
MDICPVFLDETGVLTSSIQHRPVYGIGLLIVPDPRAVTDSFYKLHFNFRRDRSTERRAIRRRASQDKRLLSVDEVNRLMWSSRHHEYNFSEVTAYNLQQYIDLLNLYFSFPDLEFHALLLERSNPTFNLARWNDDVWHAYVSLACTLLRRRLKRDVFAIVDLQGKPDDALVYLEDMLCDVPHVRGCLRATSEMSVFLQIVDVLLGCVQCDWKYQHQYYDPSSRRAWAKRELTTFVKTCLRLTFNDRFLPASTSTFRRWKKPSLFTVWRWAGTQV